jgi:hypothetical protein
LKSKRESTGTGKSDAPPLPSGAGYRNQGFKCPFQENTLEIEERIYRNWEMKCPQQELGNQIPRPYEAGQATGSGESNVPQQEPGVQILRFGEPEPHFAKIGLCGYNGRPEEVSSSAGNPIG